MASHSVYLSVAVAVAKMFSRSVEILLLLVVTLSSTEPAAVTKARQFLPALPGYVPVYIRPGDTPLEEINPDLAEAFRSYSEKNARLSFGRAKPVFDGKVRVQIDSSDISNIEDIDLEEKNVVNASVEPGLHEFHHIQKIPRS